MVCRFCVCVYLRVVGMNGRVDVWMDIRVSGGGMWLVWCGVCGVDEYGVRCWEQ